MCRDRRDYVEKQLYPLLSGAGVAMPMTSFSEPIRSAVLEILKGKPANFAELIAQLDSDKITVRDAATKALSDSFLVCHKELQAALDNPSGSLEAKARIQEVLKENRPKLEPAGVIESMGLLHDKDLLEDMLKTARSDADRKALTAALEKLKSSPQARPAN
jgi:DNA-binding protein YbaB